MSEIQDHMFRNCRIGRILNSILIEMVNTGLLSEIETHEILECFDAETRKFFKALYMKNYENLLNVEAEVASYNRYVSFWKLVLERTRIEIGSEFFEAEDSLMILDN